MQLIRNILMLVGAICVVWVAYLYIFNEARVQQVAVNPDAPSFSDVARGMEEQRLRDRDAGEESIRLRGRRRDSDGGTDDRGRDDGRFR